jgi:hypothetical protein
VIAQINATAEKLRHELLADVPASDLETSIKVLTQIRQRAEKTEKVRAGSGRIVARRRARDNGQTKQGDSIPIKRHFAVLRRG